MYELEDFGSFHVGGRLIEVSGQPSRTVAYAPSMEIEYDPNGRFRIEQVYVQYFVPRERRFEPALVLLHGGGLTGACWETTPDGRPGWLHHFLEQGFAVHVIDNVERGRSGFCAVEGIWDGVPLARTLEEAWDLFRFGHPDDFEARVPFPGQRFPIGHLEQFQRQFVPRWTSTSEAQVRGVSAALERIGPCVMICHSQGGYLGSRAAVAHPGLVRSLVCAEAAAYPDADGLAAGTGFPWLMLLGDYLERTERWTRGSEAARACAGEIVRLGGRAEVVELPDVGFAGASHMYMMDGHSAGIAAWLGDWIRSRC